MEMNLEIKSPEIKLPAYSRIFDAGVFLITTIES